MTLIKSWSVFFLVQSVIYNSVQTCTTTDRFNKNWFGATCQYKCHCKNDVACDVTNGDCPNGCDIGWFGPACQYADLDKTLRLKITDGASQDTQVITDGDDTTCADLTAFNLPLDVNWIFGVYFTWMRIVVKNAELQKESISINFPDDVTTQDVECIKVFVDKITLDIYCNISKPIQGIVLSGSSVITLCSLYISKGRNVALRQSTNQTSTESNSVNFISSNAVDGNPSWVKNSCTHTINAGEISPAWTLTFQSIVTVASYKIYNRVGTGGDAKCCLDRLKGFILKTFDPRNKIVQNYTDTETPALEVYNVLSTNPWTQVSNVQITATNPSSVIILTLCEVEIFGDSLCQSQRDKFTYGRDCENVCNCAVEGEKCFVSTGNCPSGCKAGYNGQGCNKTCDTGYFGIDCRMKCSNCSGLQCDGVDGKCTSCASQGKKLPYCIEDCDPGFYGWNCNSNCSLKCSQTGFICDVIDGKCFGCKPGFYGPNCITPCSSNCKGSVCEINSGNCTNCNSGFYGANCTTSCPDNCNNSVCDSKTGNCVNCKYGYYGSECTNACSINCKDAVCEINSGNCVMCKSGFYGANCSTSCPDNCKDSVCHIKTGNCVNCKFGYYGNMCSNVCFKNCKDSICEINSGNCTNCKSGFYGTNCTISCPTNCKDSICNINSGFCIACKTGFQGDQCVEECSNSTYGESCKASCSSNCNINSTGARLCDIEYGRCLNGCRSGFVGLDCTTCELI